MTQPINAGFSQPQNVARDMPDKSVRPTDPNRAAEPIWPDAPTPPGHGDPCGPKETYNPGLNPNQPQELSDKRIIRPKRPLPERVINDSEFQYYERQIGDSKLNFDNYQDFLRVSEKPPVHPWEKQPETDNDTTFSRAPQERVESDSTENVAPKRKPRCTKAEKLQRLREIHQLMVENCSKAYIFQYAKEKWGIGRRSVQLYMKKIEERNAKAGESRDFVAHLEMTRQQCDHMYGLTYQMLARCKDPKEFASLMRVCQSWMKIREKAVADMQEHRSLSSRDRSPSCENKQAERRRLIQMPIDEWFERITNLRNHWRWEWEQQLDMPAFVRQMKEEGNWTPDQKAYFEREHGYHDVICDCCGKTKL